MDCIHVPDLDYVDCFIIDYIVLILRIIYYM